MLRITQIFAAALAVAGVSASAVIDLIPSNFDKIVVDSGKPALVEFFAPWVCAMNNTIAASVC